jgi:hypothetical protein
VELGCATKGVLINFKGGHRVQCFEVIMFLSPLTPSLYPSWIPPLVKQEGVTVGWCSGDGCVEVQWLLMGATSMLFAVVLFSDQKLSSFG